MINNTSLKKFLKASIFPTFSLLNKIIRKNDRLVLLYNANGGVMFCNLPLRRYLLENHYDKKYNIVCGIESMKYADDTPGVSFVGGLKSIWVFLHAKHVFYTAGQLPIKPSRSQCVIHMCHGSEDIKAMGANTNINNGDEFFFTYMSLTSDLYTETNMKGYLCGRENIAIAGDPMLDDLLNAAKHPKYKFEEFDKFLLWVPTFRQSEMMNYNDSSMETLVPLFAESDYPWLNDLLAKHNIKLIVKLHPVQTAPEGLKRHFSHLSVYSHQEFVDANYEIYQLMACADGLIGDYSSASQQFLLLDRPEAYVVPDFDDYGRTRGFAFTNPQDYMGGHIVKTKEEFVQFIEDFAAGNDVYKEKRRWACGQIFKYKDANNCKRIVELSGMSI